MVRSAALNRPVVRSLSLAALVAGVLLLAGGCVGHKYVNETLYGPTREPQKHTDPLIVPDVPAAAYNDVAIAGAPVGVQSSFRQDHPDAVVTNISTAPAGNGLAFYRVTYLEGGTAHQEFYRAGGTPVDEPGVVIRPPDREAYRPTTRPAIPTTGPAVRDLQ